MKKNRKKKTQKPSIEQKPRYVNISNSIVKNTNSENQKSETYQNNKTYIFQNFWQKESKSEKYKRNEKVEKWK